MRLFRSAPIRSSRSEAALSGCLNDDLAPTKRFLTIFPDASLYLQGTTAIMAELNDLSVEKALDKLRAGNAKQSQDTLFNNKIDALDEEIERKIRPDRGRTRQPLSMTMEVIVSYVLIVVGWLGGAVNGAAISTQEFTSAERCEAARLALVEDAKARGLEDALRPICLQK